LIDSELAAGSSNTCSHLVATVTKNTMDPLLDTLQKELKTLSPIEFPTATQAPRSTLIDALATHPCKRLRTWEARLTGASSRTSSKETLGMFQESLSIKEPQLIRTQVEVKRMLEWHHMKDLLSDTPPPQPQELLSIQRQSPPKPLVLHQSRVLKVSTIKSSTLIADSFKIVLT